VTGEFEKYHENGTLKEKGAYNKMRKTGHWKYYNEEGVLVKEEDF